MSINKETEKSYEINYQEKNTNNKKEILLMNISKYQKDKVNSIWKAMN